ncbi:MAG: hypothetical protein BGN82_04325 [Alphaproteobacteria bacterium 65-7]|nr:MAG: hypothetical protein BGN82_04325 [Alphaproteobacteria bacterium 65-7]
MIAVYAVANLLDLPHISLIFGLRHCVAISRCDKRAQRALALTDELDGRQQTCHIDALYGIDHAIIMIFIPYHREVVNVRQRQRLTANIKPLD